MKITEIKTRRKQLGLVQGDLAKRAGVSKTTIALLECGANKNPKLETLQKIEMALSPQPKNGACHDPISHHYRTLGGT
jgi:predicted transcriptional regulator